MLTIRSAGKLCFGLCLASLSSGTYAADGIGLYIGAAAGKATIKADQLQLANLAGYPVGSADSTSKNDTGWKIMLGVRPVSWLGAELEYIDFGYPTVSHTSGLLGLDYQGELRAKAASVFGVLYAPIPIPAFGLYAKVGMSNLHGTVNEVASARIDCSPTLCREYVHRDRIDGRLGYGVGLQVHLTRFAIRAEYERISASTGDPSLMSLGLTYRFY
jgi:hypothetical protein